MLFDRIWEEGGILVSWQEAIIIPIKNKIKKTPGKGKISQPTTD